MAKDTYTYGLGRRKSATARVRLTTGKGNIVINEKPALDYFSTNQQMVAELVEPLVLIGKDKAYDISLRISGGGLSGQVDAAKLAIAKALSTSNEDLRSTLKKASLLKRDPREKERKKYGLRSARKREQFSKR
ncbi:MAG TPA: 30S ribosomal protein S9 [Candidatus Saccharimonadales bacterium]|jgi:small subunit ribosomal protein S9|nr:30S ribosomal protein S9 [Candidatus Saccharimonadales bacterium]